MVTDIPNSEALLPDRHPQKELFLCDISDAVLKEDMASMEHPIFSLSKRPDLKPRRYEHNGNWLEISPSIKGLATIYDKEILIYAISQLTAAKNSGRELSRVLVISARDLLIFTNRHTGGHNYELLADALTRLQGTQIKTNIKTGSEEQLDIFSLVDSAHLRRDEQTGRIIELRIKLSDWMFNAVNANEVLTLHPAYFRLPSATERRVYELVRKHCGRQPEWRISLRNLKKKCGSLSPLKRFRQIIRKMEEGNYLPDYSAHLDEQDIVVFTNQFVVEEVQKKTERIFIDADTYERAKEVAPGWDIYVLEDKWRHWMTEGGLDRPMNPDKAFIGYCRKFYERNGSPR